MRHPSASEPARSSPGMLIVRYGIGGAMYRLGVSGEREQEERAREYFDVHGVWPDEEGGRPV